MMNDPARRRSFWGALSISYVCMGIYAFIWLRYLNAPSLQTGANEPPFLGSNVLGYGLMLFVFVFAFLCARFLLQHTAFLPGKHTLRLPDRSLGILSKAILALGPVLTIALAIRYLTRYFSQELFGFDSQILTNRAPWPIVVGLCAILFISYVASARREDDLSLTAVYAVYLYGIALVLVSLFYPNYVIYGDGHHGTAFMESIYNVADLVPYTSTTTGIYGHYGLFYLIPMLLFKKKIVIAVLSTCVFGAISFTFSLYVLHQLVSKNKYRILFCAAMLFYHCFFKINNYWQIMPLREFFPALLCAYVVWLEKKPSHRSDKQFTLAGFALCSLAIVWNTESGLACLLGFVFYLLLQFWRKEKWSSLASLKFYGILASLSVIAMLCSIGMVNLYNWLCGGPAIFKEFFFPIYVPSYMNDSIRYDMIPGNRPWVYILIILVFVTCYGLWHTRFFPSDRDAYQPYTAAMASTAFVALINFSYYANRAAFGNQLIAYFPLILCIVWVMCLIKQRIERARQGALLRRAVLKSASASLFLILCLLASFSILGQASVINAANNYVAYNQSQLLQTARELFAPVPDNIYGLGTSISMWYHTLGWDNYGHFRDGSDFSVGDQKELTDAMLVEIRQRDQLVIDQVYYKQMRYFFKGTAEGMDYIIAEELSHPNTGTLLYLKKIEAEHDGLEQ